MRIKFICLIILFLSTYCKGQISDYESCSPDKFNRYICYTVTEKLQIDGQLNEESWKKAAFSKSFVDIEGHSKPLPLHDTKVKMLWDEEYLYIGARLEEPHIWARYTERESIIFHENDFEIFIDPNGDTHNYYEIEVNALNTIWDLLLTKPYRDKGKAINSWNVEGMKSAVHLEGTINDPSDIDEYWTVEFALPWSSLQEYSTENRKPNDREQWRINFSRVEWRLDIVDGQYKKQIDPKTGKTYPEFNWVWSPQGVIAMHQPETWGFLQFSKHVVGEKAVEFQFSKNELCKWELRKLYYQQRKYFSRHKKYASHIDQLELSLQSSPTAAVSIEADNNSYEASIDCAACSKEWKINQAGQIVAK